MKLLCPHCSATTTATLRQVKSGKPIHCPLCGKDIHLNSKPQNEERRAK